MSGGLERTFDTVAAEYTKLRPGYADELYKSIFDYMTVSQNSRLVEIGPGGGQATLPFLETGCELTAVECGENFSRLCRERFREHPRFSVITEKFENAEFEENSYDLVFSATAFHWIPEEPGYKKVFGMLRSGGAFARFANHPFRSSDRPELAADIDRLYGKYYYKFYGTEPQPAQKFRAEQAEALAEKARKYGFTDIRYDLFYRTRRFTAKEYTALLGTYSDHIAMEERIRTEFFSEIEKTIERHGGFISICDTMDLQLARKP